MPAAAAVAAGLSPADDLRPPGGPIRSGPLTVGQQWLSDSTGTKSGQVEKEAGLLGNRLL